MTATRSQLQTFFGGISTNTAASTVSRFVGLSSQGVFGVASEI